MSKSSKSRRSDDEFKPPSAKKSKQSKQEQQEHTSVQRIRLMDLIKYNYLCAGDEVFVKDQEGIITERGTIKVITNSGLGDSKEIEYSNPTSWTKQVTGRENGGWGQIRLKVSKQTLASIKEQYQKNVSTMEFMDDSGEMQKPIAYSSELNTSSNSTPPTDSAPSDLTLPLKVRFINDEDRVFKIMYVSPDFTEFHTEYQGTLYTNLADFVSKIFEDFQKPVGDSNSPTGNLRFDELMYELSPGKWVRLAGSLFPSDLMGNRQNSDQSYQQPMGNQSLTFNNSTPTGDNCNHKTNNHSNNCNNSEGHVDTSMGTDDAMTANNTSFDDYSVGDDDEDDDFTTPEQRRRRTSLLKKGKRPHVQCYMCLVFVEDSVVPIRVNSFAPTTVKDVLHNVFNECNLKHNGANEVDLLRDYSVEVEDYDFGGVKIAFPRSITSLPIKSKLYIRSKYKQETVDQNENSNDHNSHQMEKEEDV